MAVDHGFIDRSLLRIVEEEERKILLELSQVDSRFIMAGHGGGSSAWTLERHRISEVGIDRAAMRIIDEVRQLAGQDAPSLAENAGISVGHLMHRLLSQYRTGLGPTKEQLIMALQKTREKAVDDLRHRPVPLAATPAPLAGRDININASGPVAVAGHDVHQHADGFDLPGLLTVLSRVREVIRAAQVTSEQRDALSDEIAAIDAVAQLPRPDSGRLMRLVKRLAGTAKDVGVSVAAELLSAFIKQQAGI